MEIMQFKYCVTIHTIRVFERTTIFPSSARPRHDHHLVAIALVILIMHCKNGCYSYLLLFMIFRLANIIYRMDMVDGGGGWYY